MLEAHFHLHSHFVTLTYEKDPLDGSLSKNHLSTTLHRLRERLRPVSACIRFFGVGEYGDRFGRPHYHLALFGVPPDHAGAIEQAWHSLRDPHAVPGFVHLGDLTPDSASYVTGYLSKKLGAGAERLDGRTPEFALMSRRPGIGCLGIETIVQALNSSAGALYIARHGDVPTAFQVGGRLMPLGGHIRRQLRQYFFGSPLQPEGVAQRREKEFYEENMPFVPWHPVASVRAQLLAAADHSAVKASAKAHHDKTGQQALNRAAKHRISLSRKSL